MEVNNTKGFWPIQNRKIGILSRSPLLTYKHGTVIHSYMNISLSVSICWIEIGDHHFIKEPQFFQIFLRKLFDMELDFS